MTAPLNGLPQVQITVSLPVAIVLEVARYSAKHQLSRSAAIAELLSLVMEENSDA